MKHLWTWGGTYFGYRDGDNLWDHNGRHVGKFDGDEVFGSNGRYLGEIKNDNRLIRSTMKTGKIRGCFSPYGNRGSYSYGSYIGYVMYAGYEDFPLNVK